MNRKEYFEKQVAEKRSQIENLESALVESEDKEERVRLKETLKNVRSQLADDEKMLANEIAEEEAREKEIEEQNEENKEEARQKKLFALGTYAMRGGMPEEMEIRKKELDKELEERGKALKEKRAVTVSSDLLIPQHQGTVLNDTFNQVSTLVDMVANENLNGGESYKEAYVKSYGTGGITGEGKDYVTAEPEFGYAPMNKVKITAYAEISEEVKKLPHIDYARKVQEACLIALKKKLSQQIIAGKGVSATEGTDDEMVGILSSPVAIDSTKDLEIEKIDVNTLDEITFSFGGDEEVESMTTTILNKLTVKDLSKVRKQNGEKEYKIDVNNKTINTIPYSINSNVPDFATAEAGAFVGIYGDIKAYKMVTFSPVEIMESTDFKFKQGMICYKASIFVAGNVVKQDGFLRIKKKVE